MNINSVSPVSCKSNIFANAKKMEVPMNDGKKAMIKFTEDAYECLIVKDGMLCEGVGQKVSGQINPEEFASVMEKISSNAKESFNFLKEFTKAMLKN